MGRGCSLGSILGGDRACLRELLKRRLAGGAVDVAAYFVANLFEATMEAKGVTGVAGLLAVTMASLGLEKAADALKNMLRSSSGRSIVLSEDQLDSIAAALEALYRRRSLVPVESLEEVLCTGVESGPFCIRTFLPLDSSKARRAVEQHYRASRRAVEEVLEKAATGPVIVVGPPGTGKSMLLLAAIYGALERGMRVCRIACPSCLSTLGLRDSVESVSEAAEELGCLVFLEINQLASIKPARRRERREWEAALQLLEEILLDPSGVKRIVVAVDEGVYSYVIDRLSRSHHGFDADAVRRLEVRPRVDDPVKVIESIAATEGVELDREAARLLAEKTRSGEGLYNLYYAKWILEYYRQQRGEKALASIVESIPPSVASYIVGRMYERYRRLVPSIRCPGMPARLEQLARRTPVTLPLLVVASYVALSYADIVAEKEAVKRLTLRIYRLLASQYSCLKGLDHAVEQAVEHLVHDIVTDDGRPRNDIVVKAMYEVLASREAQEYAEQLLPRVRLGKRVPIPLPSGKGSSVGLVVATVLASAAAALATEKKAMEIIEFPGAGSDRALVEDSLAALLAAALDQALQWSDTVSSAVDVIEMLSEIALKGFGKTILQVVAQAVDERPALDRVIAVLHEFFPEQLQQEHSWDTVAACLSTEPPAEPSELQRTVGELYECCTQGRTLCCICLGLYAYSSPATLAKVLGRQGLTALAEKLLSMGTVGGLWALSKLAVNFPEIVSKTLAGHCPPNRGGWLWRWAYSQLLRELELTGECWNTLREDILEGGGGLDNWRTAWTRARLERRLSEEEFCTIINTLAREASRGIHYALARALSFVASEYPEALNSRGDPDCRIETPLALEAARLLASHAKHYQAYSAAYSLARLVLSGVELEYLPPKDSQELAEAFLDTTPVFIEAARTHGLWKHVYLIANALQAITLTETLPPETRRKAASQLQELASTATQALKPYTKHYQVPQCVLAFLQKDTGNISSCLRLYLEALDRSALYLIGFTPIRSKKPPPFDQHTLQLMRKLAQKVAELKEGRTLWALLSLCLHSIETCIKEKIIDKQHCKLLQNLHKNTTSLFNYFHETYKPHCHKILGKQTPVKQG